MKEGNEMSVQNDDNESENDRKKKAQCQKERKTGSVHKENE